MIIKKYNSFTTESKVVDIESEWNTVGRYVEFFLKDDNEDIKSIVNSFIKDFHPDVRIANAINQLSNSDKQSLINQIDNYLIGKQGEIIVNTNTDIKDLISESSSSGRNIFNSFLKAITALGMKEIKPDWNLTANDYIIYFRYNNLNSNGVKNIFSRFKSLQYALELIDYKHNECFLYYGIKFKNNDLFIEYGVGSEDQVNAIGNFKLTQSILNGLLTSDLNALKPFKSEIVNINYKSLLLYSKIKIELPKFNPGYHEQRLKPMLQNGLLSFGFYGLGKWENGKLDQSEFDSFKRNLKQWLSTYKWADNILVNINYNSFWIYINLKSKL